MPDASPDISYVVPTLNSAKTLDATLLSLTSQCDVTVEIIVVDSGSTDGTLEICDRWQVRSLYVEPGNLYAAINLGLSQCNAPWLAYLNSDDLLYSDSVARAIRHGDARNADLVYGNCDYIDFQGRFLYSFRPPQPAWLPSIYRAAQTNGFAQQTSIFRKALYKEMNGFNVAFQYCADLDFYVRAMQSGAVFSFLDGASLASFRLHPDQLSQRKAKEMLVESARAVSGAGVGSGLDGAIALRWKMTNVFNYAQKALSAKSRQIQ